MNISFSSSVLRDHAFKFFHEVGSNEAHKQRQKLIELEKMKEAKYDSWLNNFVAAKPDKQDYCKNILKNKVGSTSQFGQDLFLFFNIFKYWPMEGMKGFYIDSGANDAFVGSNTYFFDVCLGWDGVCIEPEQQYHVTYQQRPERSCKLIKECISNKREITRFRHDTTGSRIESANTNDSRLGYSDIQCDTLGAMISRYNRSRIDLWSLDVEGYEMAILQAVDFSQLYIKVVMIEEFWISTRNLDKFMNIAGFNKYHQIAIDAIYTHRRFPTIASWSDRPLFYPGIFDNAWKENNDFRIKNPKSVKCTSEEEVRFISPKPFNDIF